MFDRLSRSWGLVKASAAVLKQDQELLLFPLISLGALALVVACFALPVIGLDDIETIADVLLVESAPLDRVLESRGDA